MINFNATEEEFELVFKITNRALARRPGIRPQTLQMDLIACHLNGCPLQLQELLDAGDFDFFHDIDGIRAYIDRTTGNLTNCFLPRFALLETAPCLK